MTTQQILKESGIYNIKTLASMYKKAYIYFHRDLDGVCSGISIREYLKQYGIKTIGVEPIEYGDMEFSVSKPPEDVLAVLVDFAHGKHIMNIHTDHHQSQTGFEDEESTSFKKASSNVETISTEISTTNIFPTEDIRIISITDSADYAKHGITPEEVSNAILNIQKGKTSEKRREMLGIVVNTLILANKNKESFLTTLVMNSSPSLLSMYLTIMKMFEKNEELLNGNDINDNFYKSMIDVEEKRQQKNIERYGKKGTPKIPSKFKYKNAKTTSEGIDDYIQKQIEKAKQVEQLNKKFKDFESGDSKLVNKIVLQYGGGNMFKGYFRYAPFVVHPSCHYLCIGWPMGLIQLSKNPFIVGTNPVNLNDIFWEKILPNYENDLKSKKVSFYDVKKSNEMGLIKDENHNAIGFSLGDLEGLLGEKIKNDRDEIEIAMSRKTNELNEEEKKLLIDNIISVWDIIKGSSGGHHNIANLSGISIMNFIDKGLVTKFIKAIMTDVGMLMKDYELEGVETDKWDAVKNTGLKLEPQQIQLLNDSYEELRKNNGYTDEIKFIKHPQDTYTFYDSIVFFHDTKTGKDFPYGGVELEVAGAYSKNWKDGKTPLSFLKRKLYYFDYDTEEWTSPKEDYLLKRIFYQIWKNDLSDCFTINMYDLLKNGKEKYKDIDYIKGPRGKYFIEIDPNSPYVIWGQEEGIKYILNNLYDKYVVKNNPIKSLKWKNNAAEKKSGIGNKGDVEAYYERYKK